MQKRRALVVVILPGLYERSSRWRRLDVHGVVLQLESICTSVVQISVLNVWQISAGVFSLILSYWFFLLISLWESRGSNRQHALIRMVCFCSGLWSNGEPGAWSCRRQLEPPLFWSASSLSGEGLEEIHDVSSEEPPVHRKKKKNLVVFKITPFVVACFILRKWKHIPVKSNHCRACQARYGLKPQYIHLQLLWRLLFAKKNAQKRCSCATKNIILYTTDLLMMLKHNEKPKMWKLSYNNGRLSDRQQNHIHRRAETGIFSKYIIDISMPLFNLPTQVFLLTFGCSWIWWANFRACG